MQIIPEQIPVLAMGQGWLVVEKASGLTVHNEPGKDLCSLVRALIETSRRATEMIRMDSAFGVHAVHRLDKETSGVVLLAVDPVTFQFLSRQFETHHRSKKNTGQFCTAMWQEPKKTEDGASGSGRWRRPPAGAGIPGGPA